MAPGQAIPPGPPPIPLLGTTGNFLTFLRDPVAVMRRLHREFGDIATLARGDSRYVFVFSPAYNQRLLGDTTLFHNLDAASSPLRMPAGSPLARLYGGLTTMNGPQHRTQRRLMASAFTKARVDALAGDIVALAQRQVAGWQAGEVRDVFAEMRQLTLSVAVKTLIGLEPVLEGRRVRALLDRWMGLVFSVPVLALPFDLPGLPYHQLMQVSRLLECEVRALLKERRGGAALDHDVLSLLLAARDEDGSGLTDAELVGQTSFLFMAGHATTASALAWTLFLLAQHPSVLAGVLAELDATLAGAPPNAALAVQLELLERVLKESLRLLPPVLWWSRVSTAAFDLGPYHLPAGTRVVYSAYITHRLPALYSEPDRFLPQRWLSWTPGPYEYLPFSAGPRSCLGSAFAMLEMKLVLAVLLQRWGLGLRPGARVNRGGLMVSEPRPGLLMAIGAPGACPARVSVHGSIRTVVDVD